MIVAYVAVSLAAWLLCSGWMFAYLYGKFPTVRESREDSAAAVFLGILFAAMWPVGIPIIYLLTGYARYGWRGVWKI